MLNVGEWEKMRKCNCDFRVPPFRNTCSEPLHQKVWKTTSWERKKWYFRRSMKFRCFHYKFFTVTILICAILGLMGTQQISVFIFHLSAWFGHLLSCMCSNKICKTVAMASRENCEKAPNVCQPHLRWKDGERKERKSWQSSLTLCPVSLSLWSLGARQPGSLSG